jgi:hypothetical protein
MALFHEFAQETCVGIDDAVIQDVWEKTSGFVAQFI